MQSIHRTLLGSVCVLSLLAACDFGAVSSTSNGSSTLQVSGSGNAVGSGGGSGGAVGVSTGGNPTPPGVSVNATPSVAGTVSVAAGAAQTITVAFTSADGRPIPGLALSNTKLPADWSAQTNFTCAATGSGSNCVLTLTYAPTAPETGTLSIGYTYAGDQSAPPGLSLSIPYAETVSNNIVATPAPIGQINAAAGTGAQAVSVSFTTDDGNAATGLTILSDLSSLPSGWSTTTPGFSCAVITNGSGCQLVLNYMPKTPGSGTLTLNYGYVDGSGAARTAAINIPYSTTANGNVVATVAPAGQVNAIQNAGAQAVMVTFTTDNAQTASSFSVLSPLTSLPPGWRSATRAFTCGAVNTGHGCQLTLNYAPTSLTRGTVMLDYGYMSPAGTFTTGSVNIPYAATTNDNVVATAAPSGQIAAVVGQPGVTLVVTFTTDDARTATALQLSSDLAALPAGWASTDSAFSCASVAGGTTCQLPLTYTPNAAANGTLTLRYTYQNNAGQAKSGSVNIPFLATTDDTVIGTPSASPLAVLTGSLTPVTVSFATDDGNPASALAVTSGLGALPAGWSSADDTFTCATVSAGSTCQLALSYQPTTPDSGTVLLAFTYTNDSGVSKSGTISLPYTATAPGP